MSERTPLYVIGGSLGSGKTTLLRRILDSDPGRIAVMVNEFGEIGLDGDLLRGRDIDLMELAGGCVCCSLAGEFEAGVRELIERVRPEAILVETTGVAEADALVADIEDGLPEVRLDAVTVLVDADTARRFPELGYVERNQLEAADLVLVNKMDLASREDLDELRGRLREINPEARILESAHAHIDPRLVLPETGGRRGRRTARRDGGRDHGMQSFHWRPAGSIRRDCFERAVAQWPKTIYRAKGRLVIDGEPKLFNFVAGRWTLDRAGERDPALVWIGPDVNRHREFVIGALEDCLE